MIKKSQEARKKVKECLREITHRGKPVIDQIWDKEEVYSGKLAKNGPDILYAAKNYAYGASAISPFLDNRVFSTPHTLKTGEHRPEGILAFSPKLPTKSALSRVSICDLSATILAIFEVKPPSHFDGQSITPEIGNSEVAEVAV